MFYVVTQGLLLTFGSITSVLAYLKLFKILEESDEPFYCPHCRLVLQGK